MNKSSKTKVAVVIGSGFTASFTAGRNAPIGNSPTPTLADISSALLGHIVQFSRQGAVGEVPFADNIIRAAISLLQKNEELGEGKYDFEQLISLVSMKASILASYLLQDSTSNIAGAPDVLRCLIYFVSSLFAECLSIDGQLRKTETCFIPSKSLDLWCD
jgi:hypothetical protein